MSFPKTRQIKRKLLYINPLQVRINTKNRFGKKTLLSASASLTLEAVLALTLFIFAAATLILPMKILNTERKIQAGLEAAGEELSRFAYIGELLAQDKAEEIPGADDSVRQLGTLLAAGLAAEYARERALEHADTKNISKATMVRSGIMEDGAVIDLILDYELRLPFPVPGLPAIERSVRCRRRAWTGAAGKTGRVDSTDDEAQSELVYIGKNSTRYHQNRSCHYLFNDLSPVSYDIVETLRNHSGGKYYPCRVCAKSAGSGDMVYIMPSGSSFHTTSECSAIIAYVQVIPLAKVRHLGPCSYCFR